MVRQTPTFLPCWSTLTIDLTELFRVDLLGAGAYDALDSNHGTGCDLDIRQDGNPRAGCVIQWRTTMTHAVFSSGDCAYTLVGELDVEATLIRWQSR